MPFLGEKQQNHILKGTCHVGDTIAQYNMILNEKPLLHLRARDVDKVHGELGGTQGLTYGL